MESTSRNDELIFVLYDGVANSVFAGQVVAPLVAQLEKNHLVHATIISFETAPPSQTILSSLPHHPRLYIKIESRFRFWGMWALRVASWRLKSFLGKFDRYSIIARGPLAGLICTYALTPGCTQLIIQARGLAAEEYAYAHPKGMLAALRTWHYKQIEKSAYGRIKDSRICIEAVSDALKTFLIDEYQTPADNITVAHIDIPAAINAKLVQIWRREIRTKLAIPYHALVYCYNGSAKSWQCPRETIGYFKKELISKPHAMLLVLTPDALLFKQLLAQENISAATYRICTIAHTQMYRYLAAADIGLLFREPHILNWVSRPTKALEYQAVGLQVIHNNTVAYLCRSSQLTNFPLES